MNHIEREHHSGTPAVGQDSRVPAFVRLGYSGHKHLKGDKVVAFCNRCCNVIAPFVSAPGQPQRIASAALGGG